jgi:hypothetical protein
MMWTFASRRALVISAWTALALLVASAALFFDLQNRLHPVGGPVSAPKMAWLALALLIWLVLPALLAADPRASPGLRRAFAVLLLLIVARGAIEGWMLYVSLNWSPWYGIAHDLLCIAALSWLAARATASGALDRVVRTHLFVTILAFVPEIYFAWYMQAHFVTRGDQAIYFVPDDPAYADVLFVTKTVVICLGIYLAFFFRRWLHGTTEREPASTH